MSNRNGSQPDAVLHYFDNLQTAAVVTRAQRLRTSRSDLQDIVSKGASLKAIEQPIDTSTAAGKAFLNMLGVFAEFETNLRRERQLEGSPQRRPGRLQGAAGNNQRRRRSAPVREEGLGPTAIAKGLGIGPASVYRLLGPRLFAHVPSNSTRDSPTGQPCRQPAEEGEN